MGKELIKSVLQEHARSHRPPNLDLWPAVQHRLVEERGHIANSRLRTASNHYVARIRPRLALVGTLSVVLTSLILLGILTWAAVSAPAPVSAEEVLSRAEQMASVSGNPESARQAGIQNFHGAYLFRYRYNPNGPFAEQSSETWFQAPNNYRYRYTDATTWVIGTDGTTSYQYVEQYKLVRVQPGEVFWIGQPSGPNERATQPSLFNSTNLQEVMELARRKLPPARDPRSAPRPPYAYDVQLAGSEVVLGREAYVLELTLMPDASVQSPESQIPERMKWWVDEEWYAVLRMEGLTSEGALLQSGGYQTFEVNQPLEANAFDLLNGLPPDVDIVDARRATSDEVTGAWADVLRRVGFRVFAPSGSPAGLAPGLPYYNAPRGIISQVLSGEREVPVLPTWGIEDSEWRLQEAEPGGGYQPAPKRVTMDTLVIIQGPITALTVSEWGEGTAVSVGTYNGHLYTRGEALLLTLDREGTRIVLKTLPGVTATPETREQLMQVADSLQALSKK